MPGRRQPPPRLGPRRRPARVRAWPPRSPGANSNVLADELLVDPVSGNAVLNGIPVTVGAAAEAPEAPAAVAAR